MKKDELIAFRLPADLRSKLAARAKRSEMSESAVVRLAVKKFLIRESNKVNESTQG